MQRYPRSVRGPMTLRKPNAPPKMPVTNTTGCPEPVDVVRSVSPGATEKSLTTLVSSAIRSAIVAASIAFSSQMEGESYSCRRIGAGTPSWNEGDQAWLARQIYDRVDDQSGQAAHQSAVQPDELQVPPHGQLDALGRHLGIPLTDRLRHEVRHFVTMLFELAGEEFGDRQVQLGEPVIISEERFPRRGATPRHRR